MLNVYPHCREADGVDHCNVNKPVVPASDAGAVFLSKRRLFLADHCRRRAEKMARVKTCSNKYYTTPSWITWAKDP